MHNVLYLHEKDAHTHLFFLKNDGYAEEFELIKSESFLFPNWFWKYMSLPVLRHSRIMQNDVNE